MINPPIGDDYFIAHVSYHWGWSGMVYDSVCHMKIERATWFNHPGMGS